MTAVGSPRIGVLALQGDVIDHVRALQLAGAEAVRVRRPSELEEVDGLVLPGGESTTMIRLLRTFELLEPLRQRIAGGLPVYGSCAGMILLANRIIDGEEGQESVGGLDVVVRRNAFGRQVASFEADIDVIGVTDLEGDAGGTNPRPVRAVFIRAPWIESHTGDVDVLGRVDLPEGGQAVVAVRQGNLLATSFHPEVTDDPRIHAMFADMVRRAAVSGV